MQHTVTCPYCSHKFDKDLDASYDEKTTVLIQCWDNGKGCAQHFVVDFQITLVVVYKTVEGCESV